MEVYRFSLISFVIILISIFTVSSCKTQPPPEPAVRPVASLRYVSIEAEGTSAIALDFILKIENPGNDIAEFSIDRYRTMVNGKEAALVPVFPGSLFTVPAGAAMPGTAEIPVRLEMDIPSLVSAGIPVKDDFTVDLTIVLLHGNDSQNPRTIQAAETAVFPYIREPVFSITAIAILKAELINTRFRVTMKIDNPNHFPVELSAFTYELFGNGRLWADGTERNILSIPARSSVEANLFLLMNFINMRRDLLDQIIRLEDVNYGFNGDVLVGTGVDYLPRFKSVFDLSGYSRVYEN